MKVTMDNQTLEFDKKITVKQLLNELNLNPESHVIVVNGKISTLDIPIPIDGDVRIIRAISGG